MRTGTPLATWRSMTAAGRSATSESISTPRLIGPGVHHQRPRAQASSSLDREPVGRRELAQRGHERAGAPLLLEPEQPHDVGPLERLVEVGERR